MLTNNRGLTMTGDEFKAALRQIGWKQSDIARRMGLHRNTVNGWVSNGAPQWAAEYLRALLAIKGLNDAFVKVPAREQGDDELLEESRAARMVERLQMESPPSVS
jgi:transcriptional regulator with XRE-family HTH domain